MKASSSPKSRGTTPKSPSSRSTKSPPRTPKAVLADIDTELHAKLKAINDKISVIQKEKNRLSPMAAYKKNALSPPRSLTSAKKANKRFHHPKLEYIMAEVANSPYLTTPGSKYSSTTLRCADQIRHLKFMGKKPKELAPEELPCDIEKSKKIFIKEVIDYKARFEYHDDVKNLPMQYHDPTPVIVIGIHDGARRGSRVYPNSYTPLEGHTGRVHFPKSYVKPDDILEIRPGTTPANFTHVPYFEKIYERERAGSVPFMEASEVSSIIGRCESSGSLKAHVARGGPKKYKETLQIKKAYKDYVKQKSAKDLFSSPSNDTSITNGYDDEEEGPTIMLPPIRSSSAKGADDAEMYVFEEDSALAISASISPAVSAERNSGSISPQDSVEKTALAKEAVETLINDDEDYIYEDDDDFDSFTSQQKIKGTVVSERYASSDKQRHT